MACFKCVVLLPVIFYIISGNLTTLEFNNASISTPAPIYLNKSTEEIKINRHVQLNKTINKESKATTDSFMLLEKSLPLGKSYREIKSVDEFWRKRNALADLEVKKLIGNDLFLNREELKANKIILAKKYLEYDKVLSKNETFPPSINFFQRKSLIEQSGIFKIIQRLPKGAGLYNYLITTVPLNFIYYNLTFEDNLYYRFDDTLRFVFSSKRPAPGWRLLSKLRNTDNPEYIEDLNRAIKDKLSLVVPNSEGSTTASTTFTNVLQLYTNLTNYLPNFIKTFTQALETLYEDNIMYAELGYNFPEIYDLYGNTFDPIEVLSICQSLLEEFIEKHSNFIGIRFFYIPLTALTLENLQEFRKITINLWRSNRKLIAGFGVITMGETNKPLSFWVEEFLKFPKELAFFFDAGMTNNWGINEDYDLLDAITLNAQAIGGGVAINKHPLLLQHLRRKRIPIAVFPILVQAMGIVEHLRTYPVSLLVATNTPIVIGNAAGTVYNDTGLSYDWYMVYMAMTPRFCDIRCLKQFAINSWLYCSLPNEEKKRSIKMWEKQWYNFVDYVNNNYSS